MADVISRELLGSMSMAKIPLPPTEGERIRNGFREALRDLRADIQDRLKENEELQFFCCNGVERMRVHRIEHKSNGFAIVRCGEGENTEMGFLAYLPSLPLTYEVVKLTEPIKKKPFGFVKNEMPSEGTDSL